MMKFSNGWYFIHHKPQKNSEVTSKLNIEELQNQERLSDFEAVSGICGVMVNG